MVDPKIMCRQHLLGEHRELHALVGIIRRGTSLAGYSRNNLIETRLLAERHDNLVDEMLWRGYDHHSPLSHTSVDVGIVYREDALIELLRRCPECRERHRIWTA